MPVVVSGLPLLPTENVNKTIDKYMHDAYNGS